jgi:hypothetical protein
LEGAKFVFVEKLWAEEMYRKSCKNVQSMYVALGGSERVGQPFETRVINEEVDTAAAGRKCSALAMMTTARLIVTTTD